jgi:hypothetical protein
MLSASIALDRSQTQVNQKVRALLTVSNSGANPVTILNVVPFVNSTVDPNPNSVSAAIGQVIANVVIPAGGSNTLVWDTMIETVNPPSNYDTPPANNNYNIGCLIYGDDGSITSPTVQTVLVVPGSNYL